MLSSSQFASAAAAAAAVLALYISPAPVQSYDWELCIENVDAKLTDTSKMLTLTNSAPIPAFNKSSSTNLYIRKDAYSQGSSFCVESLGFFEIPAFYLEPNGPASGCVQRGFSFAPSSTSTGAPTPGANIWLSGVTVGDNTGGNLVASGFEGFSGDVSTPVPAVDGDDKKIMLKNGPYKMAFSKDFDVANILRFVPSSADGAAAVLCMFGKYSA
jgi:hypothetical protein